MKKFKPHDYQRRAIAFLINVIGAAYLADPGLGKTVVALTAFKLLKEMGVARRALVVAPLRVIYSVCRWV